MTKFNNSVISRVGTGQLNSILYVAEERVSGGYAGRDRKKSNAIRNTHSPWGVVALSPQISASPIPL